MKHRNARKIHSTYFSKLKLPNCLVAAASSQLQCAYWRKIEKGKSGGFASSIWVRAGYESRREYDGVYIDRSRSIQRRAAVEEAYGGKQATTAAWRLTMLLPLSIWMSNHAAASLDALSCTAPLSAVLARRSHMQRQLQSLTNAWNPFDL